MCASQGDDHRSRKKAQLNAVKGLSSMSSDCSELIFRTSLGKHVG